MLVASRMAICSLFFSVRRRSVLRSTLAWVMAVRICNAPRRAWNFTCCNWHGACFDPDTDLADQAARGGTRDYL
jgi:hypothetical protein